MDSPLLCHFTDSLQHKLDLIVLQFPDSKTIKNDIYRWIAVDCKEEKKLLTNEGSMRLLQSAINRFECKYDDSLELLTVEFSALFELFRPHLHYQKCRLLLWNADDELMYDKMLNLLQPLFVSAELNAGKSIEHSLTFHRNCCLYLYTQMNLASTPEKFQETVIQYLSSLLHHFSTNYDLIYLILKLLQNLKSSWSKVKIMVGMDTLASYFDINNLSNLYSGQIDYKRYLIGFEARWLIDNVITNKLARSGSHLVKMDSSKLTVQGQQQLLSDDNLIDYKATITTVRGSSPLSYYECLLLSSGFMSIGWATKEAEFSQWKQVGADQHSIGFDGFHNCVWHNNHCEFVSDSWKVGDIIGCSVNSDKKVFTFYLNGIKVKSSTVENFSTLRYYPAVSLTKDQLCCFNFGQTVFKYSQTNTTQTKTQSYLLAPEILEQCYWFKDNSTELIYDDTEQQNYNQLIIDLEKNLSTTSLRYQSHLKKLQSRFNELIDNNKESALQRMCQAILMHMSSSITGKKIDWIRWIFITNMDSTCDSGPSIAKFIEFLYPCLKNEHSLDQIMRRNISLVLSIVVQKYGLLCDMLTEEVSQFLFETILDSEGNKLAVLFAVITLNAMDFSNKELISSAVSILTREKFLEKLKKQSSYVKKSRFLNPYTLDFILYQIAFCARSLREQILTHLLSSNDLSVSSIDDLDIPIKVRATAVLSCQYMSCKMQLSPDLLSARSDRGWQTVLAAENVPEDDIFYCDVILLTCGKMRIGFIAEESIVDLELPLGSSDVSAISFDGFQKVIWSGKKRWPLEKGTGKIRRWKSGDVVGCEMDLSSRKVAFYLNGRKVQIPLEAIDEGFWQNEGNYYLAISLASQQHVLCNFGQKLFRYAKSQ